MRKSKIIKWNDQEVTCKELTVEEISGLFNSMGAVCDLDLIFDGRVSTATVELSTGLKRKDLQPLTPSVLVPLWDAVEEVNPFFVKTLQHLAGLGRVALQQSGQTP
jgi:hypothetical protein